MLETKLFLIFESVLIFKSLSLAICADRLMLQTMRHSGVVPVDTHDVSACIAGYNGGTLRVLVSCLTAHWALYGCMGMTGLTMGLLVHLAHITMSQVPILTLTVSSLLPHSK